MPNELRPLVITEVGGGLVQVQMLTAGVGLPEAYVVDFDREGADADDLREFRALLNQVIDALLARPADVEIYYDEHRTQSNRDELIDAYRKNVAEYTPENNPGRYR